MLIEGVCLMIASNHSWILQEAQQAQQAQESILLTTIKRYLNNLLNRINSTQLSDYVKTECIDYS